MIKKAAEFIPEFRENMRGGGGVVEMTNFVTKEELNENGRLFGTIVLKKGCGIGYHVHENESELFYILKGTAICNDNGIEAVVSKGDVLITSPGTGHSIKNESDETVELVALIINE